MAPFPYLPMAAILASLVSYLVVQMSVFSYAGFMVEYLGVVDHKDKAGYYAGLLSGAFMIGRLFSSHFWGVVADRFGCRLVMVAGLVSTVVLSVAFGTSTTFTWAFISRFLLGLLNGMITASKTLVSEVCGKEHETVGMGVVTTSWSLGTVIGPGVGGLLAEPAKHYPGTFSRIGVFGRNPYLLPNAVGAGMALLSLPLVLLFIEESQHAESIFPTFQSLKAWWYLHDGDAYGNADLAPITAYTVAVPQTPPGATCPLRLQSEPAVQVYTESEQDQLAKHRGNDVGYIEPPRSLLAQAHIRTLLLIEGIYSFAYAGFDDVFTLWSLSTVGKGGLDWSTLQIGQVFLVCGLMVLVFEIFAVPNLTPRLGVRMSQRVGSVCEIPVYFLIPLLPRVTGHGLPVNAAALILLFTSYTASNSFYVGIALALNNATGPDRRGELNGISATIGSFARAISPVICSSLFAFSIDGDHPYPFNHYLGFYVVALLRLTVACMGWNRINDTGGGDTLDSETSETREGTLDANTGREGDGEKTRLYTRKAIGTTF